MNTITGFIHRNIGRVKLLILAFAFASQTLLGSDGSSQTIRDSEVYDIPGFYAMEAHQKDSALTSQIMKAKLDQPISEYCKLVIYFEKKSWLHFLNERHQPLFDDYSSVITLMDDDQHTLIAYILSISSLYLTWGKVQGAYTLAQFAINKSLEHKEYLLLVKSYVSAGRSFGFKGDKLEAFRFLLKAKEVCDKYDFSSYESELWFEIGEYYQILNANYKSYDAFFNAERSIKKMNKVDTSLLYKYSVSKMQVLHNIDTAQFDEKEILNILIWARAKMDIDLEDKASATLRQVYIENSDLKKIKMYYELYAPRELDLLKKTDCYLYNKIKSYISEADHHLDSAEYYNLLAEKFLIDKSQSYYAFNFYWRLGQFYQRTNQVTKSIAAFEKAILKSKGLDVLPRVINVTIELCTQYKNIGDYKNALKYNQLQMMYKDSLQSIANSEQMFNLKLSNEEKIRQNELDNLARINERRFNLQYMGIIIVLTLAFLAIILMGTYKWPEWTIRLSGFVAFIMLFEFIILILDQKIHHLAHGEPWKMLAIKIGIISFLLPFHHWIEYKVMNYLISHKMLRFTRPSFYRIFGNFKTWFTHSAIEEKSNTVQEKRI
ncbi:MAG: hypothetical protein IPI99_10260 [Saprospiraceae bacterium]|nr:hypothetical protein [Saprospiraceae bacterium]